MAPNPTQSGTFTIGGPDKDIMEAIAEIERLKGALSDASTTAQLQTAEAQLQADQKCKALDRAEKAEAYAVSLQKAARLVLADACWLADAYEQGLLGEITSEMEQRFADLEHALNRENEIGTNNGLHHGQGPAGSTNGAPCNVPSGTRVATPGEPTHLSHAVVPKYEFPAEPAPDRWQRIHSRDELEAFYRHILPGIREAAKKCGYAIAVHGSMRRDLDLIAAPWVADHADRDTLANAVQRAACGITSNAVLWSTSGEKPCGRIAATLPICWCEWADLPRDEKSTGCIDLSVMPDLVLSQGHLDFIDLMVDEFKRIAACATADAEIKGLCERAITRTVQNVPVISQRDSALTAAKTLRNALWNMAERPEEAVSKETAEAALVATNWLAGLPPLLFEEERRG